MESRLQQVNGDTVLEITDGDTVVRRLSKNDLLRQQTYFQNGVQKFQTGLDAANADLQLINDAENQA